MSIDYFRIVQLDLDGFQIYCSISPKLGVLRFSIGMSLVLFQP